MAGRDELAGRPLEQAAPPPNDHRAGVVRVSRSTPVTRRVPPPDAAELTDPAASETRPARWWRAFTLHGMERPYERLDGTHVKVTAFSGAPQGSYEDSELSSPQRPTFRAPPRPWTEPLIED